MTEPLTIEFEVACERAHAFDTWTRRTSLWWPRDHTMTQDPDVEITIEPAVGGRIFERAPDGREHTWGTVTSWEPPDGLAYRWHLGQDAATPTDVVIRFVALSSDRCRVVIEHDGWDRLVDADARRDANRAGWAALVPAFTAATSR